MPINIQCHILGPLQNNTYVLTDDESHEAVVIDPAIGSQNLSNELIKNGYKLSQVWLTHAHFDHAAGVRHILKKQGKSINVCMHPSDIPLWKSGGGSHDLGFEMNLGPIPNFEIIHNQILRIGENSIQVRHTPGHTPGHVIFYFNNLSVAFVGDLIFYHSVGRSDFIGGDHQALQDSIRNQVFSLPAETRLFSGHGSQTTVFEEMRNNPFLI